MDCRDFVAGAGKLGVFLDSPSIEGPLAHSDDRARRLLLHRDDETFEFTRSEKAVTNRDLASITQVEKVLNASGDIESLWVRKPDDQTNYGFGYRGADVDAIGRVVYEANSLTPELKERNQLLFIQAVINGRDGRNLFVTADDLFLRKRLWLESHFPGGRLNIATVDEAIEIMDLVAKSKGRYLVSRHHSANRGLWYWYSFRSKIPFYNVPNPMPSGAPSIEELNRRHILESFASRFVFLLASIDEMGVQYYSGANNDTMDGTLYHFHYFISLVTGIFDSLAIETKNRLRLRFEDDRIPSRTSLSNNTGRHFLAALRKVNRPLRQHVTNHAEFINLIYALRESVIHRESLRESTFEFRSQDATWKVNFLRMPEDISSAIRQMGDRARRHDAFTEWGAYRDRTGKWFLPFFFAKAAASRLISFSNRYLRLLGFDDFIESLDARSDFRRSVEAFERDRLGF